MSNSVQDFYDAIHQFAPVSEAEPWDNCGLLVGAQNAAVTAALVALDLTAAVLDEAKERGANLIITHHPVIYPSLKRVGAESLVYRAIREDIAVISAHTNYDKAQGGVNDVLAELFGLRNTRPLESAELCGLARIGALAAPMSPAEFAAFVKQKLNCKCVKYTQGTEITHVAVGGGSCSELWEPASQAGAQAFVTAEVKHHVLLAAQAAGFTLIDAGHFATEIAAVSPLAKRISQALPSAKVFASQVERDPANYL